MVPGEPELETEHPVPLFDVDVPTGLGLLPRDDLPRLDDAFEVILLGAAYAPGGRPVRSMRVALTVGTERRELAVFGDRVWETGLWGQRVSEAEPFVRMPLTYERAFGGRCSVHVDRGAVVSVCHPLNALGLGFDPAPAAQQLAVALDPLDGYPVYDRVRRLPNVEQPGRLVSQWNDAPPPAGWATVPLWLGLHTLRSLRLPEAQTKGSIRYVVPPSAFHRAHPEWVIAPPCPGARVVLEGVLPDRPRLELALPIVSPVADWCSGGDGSAAVLAPRALILLADEARMYVTYHAAFEVPWRARSDRRVRLRLADGGSATSSGTKRAS